MKYASLLKGKLQEICTERGLSAEGTKDVLVERLEENDKLRVELEAEDEPAVPEAVVVEETAPETVADVEPTVESVPETVAAPVEPVINEEEAKEAEKNAVLQDLTKRIARSRRFGDEDAAKDMEAQKTRIEKFGLQPKAPKASKIQNSSSIPSKKTPKGPKNQSNGVSKPNFNKYHKNNRTR